jgi:Holliday junction resolvase
MQHATTRALAPIAALVTLWLAAGCKCEGVKIDRAVFPAGAGIQENLALSALQTSGWNVCYEDDSGDFGTPIGDIVAACQGTHLMLACRASATDDVLKVAAADSREVVTQPDAEGAETHHVSNGVGWYYTDSQAWGFFPAGGGLKRDTCDTSAEQSEKRLCWHVDDGALQNGFRCGDLGTDASWRRLVLVR